MKAIRDGIDEILSDAASAAGSGIGLVLRERPQTYGAYLATLNTRCCAVLITPIQPDQPMSDDVEQLRLPALIADEEDWRRAGLKDACRSVGTIGIALTGDRARPVRLVPGLETMVGDDRYEVVPGTAVTILTSGTTGAPSAVPLAFRGWPEPLQPRSGLPGSGGSPSRRCPWSASAVRLASSMPCGRVAPPP